MRLLQLHLRAFGPFSNRVLDLGAAGQTLLLIYGPNEAGKSATLRAISDLRFGIRDRSTDNFVHTHPDMRVGGVFLDAQGRQHALMRRKGRGVTLTFHPFDDKLPEDSRPVPPDIEALLTGGLSKEDYDAMFGLDHRRLREGGEALVKGEGEVGAALFEASAGVRSIPAILERLDQSARKFFMPGARGKNARVNEALRIFEEQHDAYRKAVVRPTQWAELHRQHETAAAELARLEETRGARQRQLLLIKELRAVAPLLSSLDQASEALGNLFDVILLSTTCSTERAAAEASLAAARSSALSAAANVEHQRTTLDSLQPDAAVLAVAAAIERLGTAAEAIEPLRKALADAAADAQASSADLALLASRIAPADAVETLLARTPAAAVKVDIEEKLREVERAEQAVEQHRAALASLTADALQAKDAPLPANEVRLALGSARDEVKHIDATLKRLSALPAEISAAQRAVTAAIAAIGLDDELSLLPIRPLLDAEIDTAVRQASDASTRTDELTGRIAQIHEALGTETVRRDTLLAAGAVPTADNVAVARAHREQGWSLVRGTYIDTNAESVDAAATYAAGTALPQAYEDAVQKADVLVDELRRDTERATELQACLRGIKKFEDDKSLLTEQLEQLKAHARERHTAWLRRLSESRLPGVTPGELREWQGKLALARAAAEILNAKLDEKKHAESTAGEVATSLRAAIAATNMATLSDDATLRTLLAIANEIEEQIKQREKDMATAAGKRIQREAQRKQLEEREQALKNDLEAAQTALRPCLAQLLLPQPVGLTVTRARLREFDALLSAHGASVAARLTETKSREALTAIERQTGVVARTLGDMEPVDLRLCIDDLSTRLTAAKKVQSARALAAQALQTAKDSQREHEESAARHGATLEVLCAAAGVASPTLLPEGEDRSRRKRDAQAELDRARNQLAQASRRPIEELRALLDEHDPVQMDADEASCNQDIATLDGQLPTTRTSEEAARRAVEAIDSADTAAAAREGMEHAAAGVRANMGPWVRSRLAHALLAEALKRFRDRAQGPMLRSASALFQRMTDDEFVRLVSDDADLRPVLLAQRKDGSRIKVEAMSEGTRDQLYLALRLAALELRRNSGIDLPVILDDVLMTSDDHRAGLMLQALAEFSKGTQVIVFSHHRHLLDVARGAVPAATLSTVIL